MKKRMLILMVLCFANVQSYSFEFNTSYIGLNYGLNSTDLMSEEINNTNNQSHSNYGIHIEYMLGHHAYSKSSLKFGLNFTNIGYEFQKDNLNQNYDLSYISTSAEYKLHLFESMFYIINGININYLYDVKSNIETLNNNNEKLTISRDLSGKEISNNYNRFDLMWSVGVGYDINMEGYYFSIEPKYNFSFLNHINENNQELKGMNFKNEFWSLNIGISIPLYQREIGRPCANHIDAQD